METIGRIFLVVGLLVLALSTVGSIGYGLYLWGGLGGALGASAWAAFLTWIKLVIGGFIAVVIGVVMGGD